MVRSRRVRSKKRRANPKIRALVHKVVADTGTQETIAKRRFDVIAGLQKRGSLVQEQVNAAEEIQRVFEGWSRVMSCKAQVLDAGPMGRHVAAKDAYLALSPVVHSIWRQKYIPWADEAGRKTYGMRSPVSAQKIVLSIVVENIAPFELDRCFHLRTGTCKSALQESLYRYAELAGWVKEHGKRPAL